MAATLMAGDMSPELLKVVERAKDPQFVFLSLAHLVDEVALTRASHRIRKDAAGCRRHRHDDVQEQHAALTRRIAGHFNYFGVNGNVKAIQDVANACKVVWRKWLNRRSQRSRLNWTRFAALLRDHPLPRACVCVRLWQPAS
jgi:hypothetical protein